MFSRKCAKKGAQRRKYAEITRSETYADDGPCSTTCDGRKKGRMVKALLWRCSRNKKEIHLKIDKGRRQKKVVLLGGAHHKVAYNPLPPPQLWSKYHFFVGNFLFA